MIYARRRAVLVAAAQAANGDADPAKALQALFAIVLGETAPVAVADGLARLPALGVTAGDVKYLSDVAAIKVVAASPPPRSPESAALAVQAMMKAATALPTGTIALPDWNRVAGVLEIAQRNRENFKEPVAEKVEWRNVYPAADAKAQSPTQASRSSDPNAATRWKTFGSGEISRLKEPQPAPAFGWALASPLLALGEGTRTIRLTLGFSPDPVGFEVDKIRRLLAPGDAAATVATFNPFVLELSTAKGWLAPDSVKLSWLNPKMDGYPTVPGIDVAGLRTLVIEIALGETQPSLAAPSAPVHGIDSPDPVLRLMVRQVWNEASSAYVTPSYQLLRRWALMRAQLAVGVAGLAKLHLANDQTTLDPKKPFEPFGSNPAAGSRFYFGHPELVGKKLGSVTFHVAWMGVPVNLGAYYANYPGSLNNASFKARVALVDRGVLRDFSGPLPLFDAADATKPTTVALAPPADQGNPAAAAAAFAAGAPADVTAWNCYLLWELNTPDFQHAAYPALALQKSLAMAASIAKGEKPDAAGFQVNPPYTPKIKSLTVDYTAATEFAIGPFSGAAAAAGAAAVPPAPAQAERVFHIEPFGYCEPVGSAAHGVPFLPQYDFEGELYVGLSGVAAPQNVALLFQMAEGSANPDAPPAQVEWSYLSGDLWLSLQDGALLADGTRGLINSGIVELALPAALANTRLPPDVYWIRAAVARSADAVCDMVEIHPNAVPATFADQGNAPDHLAEPLPAGAITGPQTPIPGLAKIRQPYTSFGGKMAELDADFYVRVSERLRHKQRALTVWDYERLVLEKFPDVYKVKCLPADPVTHPHDPGLIDLIVIPDIRNRLPFDPFEPKAPADLLADIARFLRDKTPAFARVRVKNARYTPVKVRCGVRFVAGEDEGFCRVRLNDELNRFLSPWAYEEGADLVIGGSVYANSIINFIDRRDYVDYVAEFKLFTSTDDGENFELVPPAEGYRASARRPDGVLVAARQHEFDVISTADYRAEGFAGIGYMKLELDFIVA